MRLTILFLLVSFCSFGQASFHALISEGATNQGENYYVSNSGSGTGDGSIGDPFTITQLQTLITAGWSAYEEFDTVFFNRGETFTTQITVPATLDYLKFDAYGTGAKPVFDGSTDYSSGWTNDSGNIYYATVATEPNAVFMNNRIVKMAETGWILIKGRSTQLKIEALSADLDPIEATETIDGAYLYAKEWPFRPCFRVTVTNYTTGSPNGVLDLDSIPNTDGTGAATGMPFKLMNKKSYINEVGEWSWDDATNRLYILTAGGAPTNVKVSTNDYGIRLLPGADNFSVHNIVFKYQFLEGFNAVEVANTVVKDCEFHDMPTNAASWLGDCTGMDFSNNIVSRVRNNGVHVGSVHGGTISYNQFDSLGIMSITGPSFPQYKQYFRSVGCAIHLRWDTTATSFIPKNLNIFNNEIYKVGYVGIVVTGTGHEVYNNYIESWCRSWSDGAGIYATNVYLPVLGGDLETSLDNIHNNILKDGVGSAESMEGIAGNREIHGIYTDAYCDSLTIADNYVESVFSDCLVINIGNMAHVITGNTFIDGQNACVEFKRSIGTSYVNGAADKHTFTNNKMATRGAAFAMIVNDLPSSGSYNPFANGGSSDYNSFYASYRQFGIRTIFSTSTNINLASWKTVFSTDANSITDVTKRVFVSSAQALIDVKSEYNFTASPTSLDASAYWYLDSDDNSHVTSKTIPAYGGALVIRDYAPEGTLVVEDTYTGSAGNLSGHTPDTGSPWTIATGTHSLTGSGTLTSSVAGYFYNVGSGKNATIEIVAQVSSGVFTIPFRYIGTTDRVLVQLLQSNANVIITSDGSTIATITTGATVNANTDYTIKARLVDGTVTVWLDGTVIAELFNNATVAANNTSTFNHGLYNPTTGTQNRIRIWNE